MLRGSLLASYLKAIALKESSRSGAHDIINGSSLQNTQRYILGLHPLEIETGEFRFERIRKLEQTGQLAFDLKTFSEASHLYKIEVSTDLKNWTPISVEELIIQADSLSQGRIRLTFGEQIADQQDATKFYRIACEALQSE